jgi:hypothetical protein
MQKRRPRRDGAAQGRIEHQRLTPKQPESQTRRPFAVIIARDLWRRCVVCVEPPTCSHQPRSFPGHAEAMAFAEELARLEGWALIDRTGGAE